MIPVGPGDLLQAVESYSCPGYAIERGRIYVCVSVVGPEMLSPGCCAHGPHCRTGGVTIREVPLPPAYFWCAASFKPVGRPAANLIRQLQEPVAA